ncbi:MAG TPA: acyl-CoA dehydrogenase family protein, partial [Acidimicrobiales bacterium]|nr:acyl-CoA dehydrogenase family protein [Acidimicrobiales bacterium]
RKEADSHARQLVAEAHALDVVSRLLSQRVATGIATGAMPGPAGAIMRLFAGMAHVRRSDIALELGGGGAGAWTEGAPSGSYAEFFLSRQGFCLGGGSTEMQRNIISERVLDMPREPSPDRELPFGQVRRNAMPRHGG